MPTNIINLYILFIYIYIMMFKNNYNSNSRKNESAKILLKYPNRIPVIVNKCNKSTLNELNKNKFYIKRIYLYYY